MVVELKKIDSISKRECIQMRYKKNPECPQEVWDEEVNQLHTLNDYAEDQVEDCKKRISKITRELDEGVGEAKYNPLETAVAKRKVSELNQEINNINNFVDNPYFAHVELTSDDEKIVIYLSQKEWSPTFFNKDSEVMVVDIDNGGTFTEALASNYYNKTLQNIKYKGTEYKYEIYRNITIDRSELKKVFPILDKSMAELDGSNIGEITDMFLLEMLSLRKNDREMRDIIATIQKKQYEIITQDPRKNFIVQGCAGSGKTAIMLHRLRHMKKRNRNIDWEKTIIVTPSPLFKNYSMGMIKEFNLDIIQQTTLEELYWDMLKQYDEYFVTSEIKVGIMNNEFPERFINEIQSNNMLGLIAKEAISFIDGQLALIKEFGIDVDIESNQIVKEKITEVVEHANIFEREWNQYTELKKTDEICITFADSIRELEKEYKSNSRKLKELSLKVAEKWAEFAQEEDVAKQDKIQKYITSSQEKIDELRVAREKTFEMINLYQKELDEYTAITFKDYAKYFDVEDITKLRSARINLERIERRTFDYVLSNTIKKCKEKYGIQGVDKYTQLEELNRTELWTMLYIYKYVNGNARIEQLDYINIDEGQNINVFEYKLLMAIQEDAVFNVYGDIQQKYYDYIGIDDWNVINIDNVFKLDENYRNSASVVEYCNEKDNTYMIPMGNMGAHVRSFDNCEMLFDDAPFTASLDNDVIFIVKDYSVYQEVEAEAGWTWNTEYINGNSLNRSKECINVIPLEAAIGMEFKDVVVFERNMSESQKYIAHTRALNKLTVVTS